MKYGVYTSVTGNVRAHALAPLTNNEEWINGGWELVATTKTKAEARKIVQELGWVTVA